VGLGLFLVALAVTGSVAAARPRRISTEVVLYAALGLALAAMTMIRAAEWVVAVDALYALGLACLVVVGGSTWTQVIRAPLMVAARVPAAVPFLWRAARPEPRRQGRLTPVLRGTAIGVVLLGVFGGLFASADRAFAHIVAQILLPDWDVGLVPFRIVVFGVVAVITASYAAAGPRFAALGTPLGISLWNAVFEDERRVPRRLGRTEWTMALGLLDILFAGFVVLQITVLFGGHDHVLRTAGLTYAEYARQGFFQLLAVGILTLAVVAGAVRWAARNGSRDSVLLRILLGVLCSLTLVILASALRRLGLYEDAFGFTQARLTAHAVIWWLGGILLLVMAAGVRMRGWWLPRAVVAVTAGALLVFSAADPDGLVASRNVDRFRETGRIDVGYLSGLSADAFPALAELPSGLRSCVLGMSPSTRELRASEPWYAWNLGRERARRVLAAAPHRRAACPVPPGR
jgi:hypothetical protein